MPAVPRDGIAAIPFDGPHEGIGVTAEGTQFVTFPVAAPT
jgi:hypothetical protein